jgi:hypothetical protein
LGLSIATSLKLFDFVNEWMYLKLPGNVQGEREVIWLNFYSANCLLGRIQFDPEDPFTLLRPLAKNDLLRNFFEDENRTINNIFLGNLLASLIEFRLGVLNPRDKEALVNRPQDFSCDVIPFWCIMGTERFIPGALELFGDSASVYNYVFPKHEVNIDEFWKLWKQWKCICGRYWSTYYMFIARMIKHMTLPGEPTDR